MFQSARPARGATSRRGPPRIAWWVSIRTPREGRDDSKSAMASAFVLFQSARPARGATSYATDVRYRAPVSIRTPREGRDSRQATLQHVYPGFNPHAPRGARRFG